MNTRTRRRLIVVTGVIVAVVAVVLAVAGSAGAARTVSVAEALEAGGERVKVSGAVVDDSFSTEGDVLTFDIREDAGDSDEVLHVCYDGAASATFGNGVTAICTGVVDASGGEPVLNASELVTQCPSKYESATDALGVAGLLGYGDDVVGATVKVAGTVKAGTLVPAGTGSARFVLCDAADGAAGAGSDADGASEAQPAEVPVFFDGALSEGVVDGARVVVAGSLSADGSFTASSVAQEG